MTTVIKSHKNQRYYICIELSKDNLYTVSACPLYDTHYCGYPIREMIYPLNERKQALATYNRYVKKYTENY